MADEDGSANIVEILLVYVTCHNGSLLLAGSMSEYNSQAALLR